MGLERWIGVLAGLAAGIALLVYMYAPGVRLPNLALPDFAGWFGRDEEALQAPAAPAEPPVAPIEETAARYPVPAADPAATPPAVATAQAAPDLSVSDAEVRAESARVLGEPVEAFLVPQRVIQNIVATVDSLDREAVPMRYRAIIEVPGQPVVETSEDSYRLSTDNDERYRAIGDALRAADGRALAQLYLRWYPLFQRAYREMGYPGAHFNDRVVAVIDHLLATPEVARPIELVRPDVLYEFADPGLERLSSGQKAMIRIGPANAVAVKQRLREVRAVITAGAQPRQGGGEPNGSSRPSPAPAEPSRSSAGSSRGQL